MEKQSLWKEHRLIYGEFTRISDLYWIDTMLHMQIGSPLRPGAVFWIAVVLLLLLVVSPAAADDDWVTLQTWDFESGTNEGWRVGSVYGHGPYMTYSLAPSLDAYAGNYSLKCSLTDYSLNLYAPIQNPVDADEYRLECWSQTNFGGTFYLCGVEGAEREDPLRKLGDGSGAPSSCDPPCSHISMTDYSV